MPIPVDQLPTPDDVDAKNDNSKNAEGSVKMHTKEAQIGLNKRTVVHDYQSDTDYADQPKLAHTKTPEANTGVQHE